MSPGKLSGEGRVARPPEPLGMVRRRESDGVGRLLLGLLLGISGSTSRNLHRRLATPIGAHGWLEARPVRQDRSPPSRTGLFSG